MERQNLMGPFDLHLQWFGEGEAAATGAAGAAGEEGKPKEGAEGKPAEKPAEQELKAEGWTAQLPDKYKKDQKYLKDLLQHKTLGEAIDRLYAAETKSTELQAKLPLAPTKAEEYQFDELKFPEHLAGDAFAKHRELVGVYLKAQDEKLRGDALKQGLSKEGARAESNRFREAIFATSKATQDDQAKQREAGLTALKAEWKGDFAAQEELARRAIMTFGGEELAAEIAGGPGGGLENSPNLIKAFNKIGKAIGEGQLVPGKAGPAAPTKEQAETERMKKRYDKSPELTGAPAAGPAVDQVALDRLAKRFPKQTAEMKK
jgi:hypothetical protein